ncbi:hypothetical protein DAPPUDRAFT_279527 [Daphnia pulex]|uniref:Uncharacterized protein n=1 Tax=Daphnia pulex TaxID=6669 RepID=E9I7G1_DAPPU|nr:hypothetical protein DAPPUDRAFT_279527 [Daphnia pulex]|eukprot:EFX60068.1 hypothetical protein DAPPUDRAFT_279527 [Daphnia pulex]
MDKKQNDSNNKHSYTMPAKPDFRVDFLPTGICSSSYFVMYSNTLTGSIELYDNSKNTDNSKDTDNSKNTDNSKPGKSISSQNNKSSQNNNLNGETIWKEVRQGQYPTLMSHNKDFVVVLWTNVHR